jgi:hypothetical protein
MITTAAHFKTLAVLCIQGAMLCTLAVAMRPALRNPRYRIIVRGLRGRHFGNAILIFLATLVVSGLLISNVPLMDIGWFTLLGGTGNVAVAAPQSTHASELSLFLPLVLVVFVFSIAPIAAFREERAFRRGTEKQSSTRRWTRQVVFGLTHLIMGIPLGVALGLAVAGGGFMRVYRRRFAERASRLDAVLESTRTHLAYNLMVLTLIGAAALILLLGPRG